MPTRRTARHRCPRPRSAACPTWARSGCCPEPCVPPRGSVCARARARELRARPVAGQRRPGPCGACVHRRGVLCRLRLRAAGGAAVRSGRVANAHRRGHGHDRSEEHTSELQSHLNIVCRLLLEKKKKKKKQKKNIKIYTASVEKLSCRLRRCSV